MLQKLVTDPFLILINKPKQPLHARTSFRHKIFWKRIIKKPLKSWLYFFFRIQSLLRDKVIKNKSNLEIVTSRSSDCKTVQKNAFISYVLSDQIWVYNTKRFLNYSKNYICKFMQANSWLDKLFHLHMSFWIWKVWKGREKI